jgi:FkbM family methyltransferase
MPALVRRVAQRGLGIRTVIDVGAAAGRWTRKALPLFEDAQFLLLEPLEERRAPLEALRAEHPRVHCSIAAAGRTAGSARLNIAEDLDGSGIYERNGNTPTREVPVTSLDAEVARLRLLGPFLLKLDTHGFELPILEGAAATLAETAAIIMEVYNFKPSPTGLLFHEMCAQMAERGFRCADLADPMLRPQDGILWQMDLLFLRAENPVFSRGSYQWVV